MNELEPIRELISQGLDTDNAVTLKSQLSLRSSYQARISYLYREAEELLAKKRRALYPVQLSSEDKRKNEIDGLVASEQRRVNELMDLAKILSDQLSLGQSLLRSMESEMKAGLK